MICKGGPDQSAGKRKEEGQKDTRTEGKKRRSILPSGSPTFKDPTPSSTSPTRVFLGKSEAVLVNFSSPTSSFVEVLPSRFFYFSCLKSLLAKTRHRLRVSPRFIFHRECPDHLSLSTDFLFPPKILLKKVFSSHSTNTSLSLSAAISDDGWFGAFLGDMGSSPVTVLLLIHLTHFGCGLFEGSRPDPHGVFSALRHRVCSQQLSQRIHWLLNCRWPLCGRKVRVGGLCEWIGERAGCPVQIWCSPVATTSTNSKPIINSLDMPKKGCLFEIIHLDLW